MNARRKQLVILAALFLTALLAFKVQGPVSAQSPVVSDNEVNAVAKELYCPVCENIPLDVCPTTACAQWRELIRELLAEGKSEQEVKDIFVARYGDRVLAEPPRYGFNWLVYVLPPALFLVGAVVVYRALRSSYKPVQARTEAPKPTSSDDPYLNRVEEELRRRSGENR